MVLSPIVNRFFIIRQGLRQGDVKTQGKQRKNNFLLALCLTRYVPLGRRPGAPLGYHQPHQRQRGAA